MKQYSTFLFDFDGTLLDSNAHVIRCFQLAFQEVLGVTLPEETITATFGIPLADACGMSLLQEIDGARAVLEALHARGCTNAIVTSKKEVNARAQMAHIGIDHLIDLLVGPEKTTAHKPDPAPVRYAINALDADPRDCLMIGDSPNDILCGKNAHIDTAGVRFTAVSLESLEAAQPTYMIGALSELLALAKAKA